MRQNRPFEPNRFSIPFEIPNLIASEAIWMSFPSRRPARSTRLSRAAHGTFSGVTRRDRSMLPKPASACFVIADIFDNFDAAADARRLQRSSGPARSAKSRCRELKKRIASSQGCASARSVCTIRYSRTHYSLTSFTYFASPSDFSALPLSSLSAFMNSAKPAESR
jgi:hypothetical protein